MTQKTIDLFLDKIYSELPDNNYSTDKTEVYHYDDIWSLDLLDLKGFDPKIIRGYRYVLVVTDMISNFGWTVLMKKNAQTIKDFFGKNLITSER